MRRPAASARFEKENSGDSVSPSRKKIVRQDRVDVADERCFIEYEGEKCKVLNYSTFGLAVLSAQERERGSEHHQVLFVFENFELAELHLRVVRCERQDEGYRIAFEILGDPLDICQVQAIQDAKRVVADQQKERAESDLVPNSFKSCVFEAKDWLDTLQGKIDELANEADRRSAHDVRSFEDTVTQVIGEYLAAHFTPIFAHLSDVMRGYTAEQVKASIEFFRGRMKHYIYRAPFVERSFSKPLGYAGDFEMMNLIYRNEPMGDTLFAKCLHRYFVSEPAARAVRNRSDYLHSKIRETFERAGDKPLKFLSVAAGPAFEIEKFLSLSREHKRVKAEFHLLDQDEASLKYAQRRLERLKRENDSCAEIKLVYQPIRNVISQGVTAGEFDLVYSAGLFDYFSDPLAQVASSRLFDAVAPGGRLIIGNFDISNPNRFLMELVLDWQLIYRSEIEMQTLFGHLPGRLQVQKEATGINLFCVIQKRS